jgi:gibberellin 2-oxidase
MPSIVPPERPALPKWERPGKTEEELAWADIKVIDLSTFDEDGGKAKLAEELREAVRMLPVF